MIFVQNHVPAGIAAIMAAIFSMIGLATSVSWPPLADTSSWGAILWLGLISTGLARIFLFSGIQLIGSKQAALFSPLDLVIALFLSVVFLNEELGWRQGIATIFIIVSVLMANLNRQSNK